MMKKYSRLRRVWKVENQQKTKKEKHSKTHIANIQEKNYQNIK